jgi:hypothetical protein
MATYINVDSYIKYLEKNICSKCNNNCGACWLDSAKTIAEAMPAEDVVNVVRCRDCRHFTKGMAVGICYRAQDKPLIPVTYNHFCSYGERREV